MRARRLGLTTTSAQRTRCTESAPRRSTRPTLPGSRRGPRRRAPAMTASSSPTAQYRLPRATTGAPSGITGFTRCERATPPYRSLPPRLESARRVHRGKRKGTSSQPATGAPLNKNPRQNTTERRDHANRVPVQRRGLPSRTATATATATALPPPWRIPIIDTAGRSRRSERSARRQSRSPGSDVHRTDSGRMRAPVGASIGLGVANYHRADQGLLQSR